MIEVDGAGLPPCPHCGERHPPQVLKCPSNDVILPLEGRVLDEKFRLERRLGTGGMASVWLATNTQIEKQVAIKIIRPEVARSEDLVARFRAEARAAGRIAHPNICEIHDYGVGPVGPYIVMEYLRGLNLGELMAKRGQLEPKMTVGLIRQALAGLQAAHETGIIHRDLKPENVFLHHPESGDPIVKLMDFGVAKFIDGSGDANTRHGALLGTPEYMAPEQFKGASHAEPRTDIWAMGAILYRALTGHNAFRGPTVAAILLMVTSEDPTPISVFAPNVPPALSATVMKCLSRDRQNRYASAATLSDALRPFDEATPTTARWPIMRDGKLVADAETTTTSEPVAVSQSSWSPPRRSSLNTRAWLVIGVVLAGAVAMFVRLTRRPQPETVESAAVDPSGPAATDQSPGPDPEPRAPGTTHPSTLSDPSNVDPTEPSDPQTDPEILGGPDSANVPAVEPPPAETFVDSADGPDHIAAGGNEDAAETDPSQPPPDPPDVIRAGRYLTPVAVGIRGTLKAAKQHCQKLAQEEHASISGWHLANPTVAATFAGKTLRRGRYWTSALWKRRAIVVSLPSGKKSSVTARRYTARPLCVAKWPT